MKQMEARLAGESEVVRQITSYATAVEGIRVRAHELRWLLVRAAPETEIASDADQFRTAVGQFEAEVARLGMDWGALRSHLANYEPGLLDELRRERHLLLEAINAVRLNLELLGRPGHNKAIAVTEHLTVLLTQADDFEKVIAGLTAVVRRG